MNSRVLIINIVLALVVVFETFSIARIWSPESQIQEPDSQPPKPSIRFTNVQLNQTKSEPLSVFNDIPKYNLFNVERKEYIPEIVKEPEAKVQPETVPVIVELNAGKITLFGVIIVEDVRKALVSDVDNQSQASSIWVEKGDTIDGFTVSSIEKDRLIVEKSGKKNAILLYDDKNPKKREAVPKQPSKQPVEVKKVISTAPKPSGTATESGSPNNDDEYEVISTPFGEFRRKKNK